jgi:hypothetical protein
VCPIARNRQQNPRIRRAAFQAECDRFAGLSGIAEVGPCVIRVGEVPGSNPGAPIKAPQMRGFLLPRCAVLTACSGPEPVRCQWRVQRKGPASAAFLGSPRLAPALSVRATSGAQMANTKPLVTRAFARAPLATSTALPAQSLPKPDAPSCVHARLARLATSRVVQLASCGEDPRVRRARDLPRDHHKARQIRGAACAMQNRECGSPADPLGVLDGRRLRRSRDWRN